MARYTLPSLLQGHPPSQSSGTLMSLQEGIAVLRARMVALEPSCREPSGRCPNLPYGLTTAPKYLSCSPVSCLRCLTPAFPSPPPRTLFPSRGPAFRSLPHSRTLPRTIGRGERSKGEVGMFRRDIRVSEAKRGRVPCRSKEYTASTRRGYKKSPATKSGAFGAADGL